MNKNIIFNMAVRNLYRHKAKNILMILAIMLGCFLYFIASSFENNVRNNWKAYYSKTITGDYYITSFQNLGDDYNFFNPVLGGKFINKKIIKYLNSKKIPYTKRIRVGAVYYDANKKQFAGLVNLIGMDFAREQKYLSNIKMVKGAFIPRDKNGLVAYDVDYGKGKGPKIGNKIIFFLQVI